jgi:hypothetical protein
MSGPSSVLRQCIKESDNKRIVVRANNRTATFLNEDEAQVKVVDLDCLIKTTTAPRADYIVAKPKVVDVIVELKGKDIDHAIEQILATATFWKTVPPYSPHIGALVVFTRSPMRSAALDNIRLKLLKLDIWLEMGKSGLRDYEFETFTGARR